MKGFFLYVVLVYLKRKKIMKGIFFWFELIKYLKGDKFGKIKFCKY